MKEKNRDIQQTGAQKTIRNVIIFVPLSVWKDLNFDI